jgi:cobalt-zinc-cadmium efflux system protein
VTGGQSRGSPPVHSHPHASGGSHHGQPLGAGADDRRLVTALGLIVAFMAFEVVAAVVGHSLALLADAGHMLTDAAALGAGLFAIRVARRPAGGSWTFGFKRAEVLSAQANGITLLVVGALVAAESVRRLLHPPAVTGVVVVVVATVGVVVNVGATWVLSRADRDSFGVKGVVAHVVTDLYAFLATVVAGIVIVVTGFSRADSIASLVVVALMLRAAWRLLRETGRVLLEAAPEGVVPADVTAALTEQPAVASVHDVHVWLITSGFPALSAHVLVRRPADCHEVRRDLESLLCRRFGLDHTTLQVDHAPEELLRLDATQLR